MSVQSVKYQYRDAAGRRWCGRAKLDHTGHKTWRWAPKDMTITAAGKRWRCEGTDGPTISVAISRALSFRARRGRGEEK